MGRDGLKEASEVAVLNANYLKKKILEANSYELPFRQLRKHEFVLSCEKIHEQKGIRAMDIAKRLLDYGFHPPTVYFPLLVKEALMIEPTESETMYTLDSYADALIQITKEHPTNIINAPQCTPVKRIDEAGAIKNPILTWKMMNSKESQDA